jgi:formate dehydrogenase subunit gamma
MRDAISVASKRLRSTFGASVLILVLATASWVGTGAGQGAFAQTDQRAVEEPSPVGGNVPGGHLGAASDTDIWRAVRGGIRGTVSIPDKQAGQMIQSEGDNWRARRNGPLTMGGIYGLFGIVVVLALFFFARGRIKIEAGLSGKTIERFNDIERFAHWLTAVCFIVLALTGLNLLYGRHVLLPVLGPTVFTTITIGGKYLHNYLAFGFMLGIVMMLVLWVRHNFPNKHDLVWLSQAGGLFTKGSHPPSRRFNAGQKILFWLVVLGGLLLSLSGLSLLFPFAMPLFDATYALFGLGPVLPVEEMQLAQLWHAVVGLVLIVVVVAHIYIGSLGMEGAFDAMGSGHVDENWAREHHNMWVAEVEGKAAK